MIDPTPRPATDAGWAVTDRGHALLEFHRRLDCARAVRGLDLGLVAYQLAKAAQARRVFAGCAR
jgi:hypothetical protein